MHQDNAKYAALLLLFFTVPLNAQLGIEPDSFFAEYTTPLNEPVYDIYESQITNTSSDTVRIGWYREISPGTPPSWYFPVQDQYITYPPFEDQSPFPVVLAPGATDGYLALNAYLSESAGCSDVMLVLYDYPDPSHLLDTVTYSIRYNDPDCSTTSTQESSTPDVITLSPNPVFDVLYCPEGHEFDAVSVYTVLGERLMGLGVDVDSWDVSWWSGGIYVLRFLKDGRVVGIGKMVKA